MTALAHFAFGLRLALPLFGVMALLTFHRGPDAAQPWERHKNRGLVLLAAAALAFSPSRLLWIMGHPAAHLVALSCESTGSLLACVGWIEIVAARGLRRGLTPERVRRGYLVNLAVLAMMVGAAWIPR